MRVRVGTFNVRNGLARDGWNSWPFRRGATAAALRGLDADVVGLQEAFGFQARGLQDRCPGYGFTGSGRSPRRWGERCSVAFRRGDLTLVSSETRWYGATPTRPGTKLPDASFPRIATIVRLRQTGGGPTITVVNTHLDEHHERNRVAAAEQVLTWMDDGPTVVVGDLNAVPDSPVVAALLVGGLTDAVPADAPGTNHGFTGHTDGRRIDHILMSHHWTVSGARVDITRPGGRLPSDHWPVTADLVLDA